MFPKGYSFIDTAARWPWRSAFAKKCVTTKLPNEGFLKIYSGRKVATVSAHTSREKFVSNEPLTTEGDSRMACGSRRSVGVNRRVVVHGADLGSSSNKSNEAHFGFSYTLFAAGSVSGFDDRRGGGFLAIGDHARVSRS